MALPLLHEIVIIFGLAIVVLFVCYRLHLPTLVGFFLTGVLAGPHGFGLIRGVRDVELLAEIGVVLLLFTIGLEFSLKDLLQIKKAVLVGGSLQVLLTVSVASVMARYIGHPLGPSLLIGFLLSLSSTAIVLKQLQERAEIDSPHGRLALALLIFQDLSIVPMMLFTPLLAGISGQVGQSFLLLMGKGVGIVLLVVVGARWIVPQVLYQIARTRSRELFLLSIVVLCLAIAWLTSGAGLSLALGAFLAGLIISESEYSHQALGSIVPFRDVFTSFFFVSIGMLLDIDFLLQRPGFIAAMTLGVLALKTILAGCAIAFLGFPLRTMLLVGLALSQVGEFSFILSRAGVAYGLIGAEGYQLFLAVSVLTMAVTPFVIAVAPRTADAVTRLPLPRRLKSGLYPVSGITEAHKKESLTDHLIIVGFGVNGRNVARAARVAAIPYVILEVNAATVRRESARGEPILFGDATQEAVLEQGGITQARVLVVAISDPVATRRITAIARRLNPKIHIIARTRFIQEMKPLMDVGADEVIPEEFETSVEIFTRVLMKYLVPREEIERFITEVRADGYEMFRSFSPGSAAFTDVKRHLADVEISTFRVGEKSFLVGKSLAQIELRKKYGVTLLAIRRDSHILSNPGGDTKLCANDVLMILGTPDKIRRIARLFREEQACESQACDDHESDLRTTPDLSKA